MNDTTPAFDRHMLEALVCPVTQTVLEYDAEAQELISRPANLAKPPPRFSVASQGFRGLET